MVNNEQWNLVYHNPAKTSFYFMSNLENSYSRSFWITFLSDGSVVFTGDWEPLVWKRRGNFKPYLPIEEYDIFPLRQNEIAPDYFWEKVKTGASGLSERRKELLFNMIVQAMEQIKKFLGRDAIEQ